MLFGTEEDAARKGPSKKVVTVAKFFLEQKSSFVTFQYCRIIKKQTEMILFTARV